MVRDDPKLTAPPILDCVVMDSLSAKTKPGAFNKNGNICRAIKLLLDS